jgi:hypothetical protein
MGYRGGKSGVILRSKLCSSGLSQRSSAKLLGEVIFSLKCTIPTTEELKRRRDFYERTAELPAGQPESPDAFPNTEVLIREDRDR